MADRIETHCPTDHIPIPVEHSDSSVLVGSQTTDRDYLRHVPDTRLKLWYRRRTAQGSWTYNNPRRDLGDC